MWNFGRDKKNRNEWLATDRRERTRLLVWFLGAVALVGVGVALLVYALV